MTIEIRELLIKVRIEEEQRSMPDMTEMEHVKQQMLKACRKEIRKQLKKYKER